MSHVITLHSQLNQLASNMLESYCALQEYKTVPTNCQAVLHYSKYHQLNFSFKNQKFIR